MTQCTYLASLSPHRPDPRRRLITSLGQQEPQNPPPVPTPSHSVTAVRCIVSPEIPLPTVCVPPMLCSLPAANWAMSNQYHRDHSPCRHWRLARDAFSHPMCDGANLCHEWAIDANFGTLSNPAVCESGDPSITAPVLLAPPQVLMYNCNASFHTNTQMHVLYIYEVRQLPLHTSLYPAAIFPLLVNIRPTSVFVVTDFMTTSLQTEGRIYRYRYFQILGQNPLAAAAGSGPSHRPSLLSGVASLRSAQREACMSRILCLRSVATAGAKPTMRGWQMKGYSGSRHPLNSNDKPNYTLPHDDYIQRPWSRLTASSAFKNGGAPAMESEGDDHYMGGKKFIRRRTYLQASGKQTNLHPYYLVCAGGSARSKYAKFARPTLLVRRGFGPVSQANLTKVTQAQFQPTRPRGGEEYVRTLISVIFASSNILQAVSQAPRFAPTLYSSLFNTNK
ncbi:hypothetical protein ACRALDRAFT_206961 [Sodiomyces alcalophilus JCM 7366]|uniref:uncharacterized protein n=1 Tax=Sodiomyces alcalophilus JCM 7366 TaxID=591952 RepID=UPI0039B4CCE3